MCVGGGGKGGALRVCFCVRMKGDDDKSNSQALANTAWVFAIIGMHEPKLQAEIAAWMLEEGVLHNFTPQKLANAVWAFATLGVPNSRLDAAVLNYVTRDMEDSFFVSSLAL